MNHLFASGYALLAVAGLWFGHRWAQRMPALGNIAGPIGGPLSVLLVVFMPVFAGMGLMVTPRLFRMQFPGEQRAAELTARLRAQRIPPQVGHSRGGGSADERRRQPCRVPSDHRR